MNAVTQAVLRIESEALRQRAYWKSKESSQLAMMMLAFWNYVQSNPHALLIGILNQSSISIKDCEQGQQHHK